MIIITRTRCLSTLLVATLCGVYIGSGHAASYNAGYGLGVYDPYVGVEVIQTNQNYQVGYGNRVFYKNTVNINMFAGSRFSKHIGFELGYEIQPTHSNAVILANGDSLPGNDIVGDGESVTVESTMKMKYPYLGVFGEYKTNFQYIGVMKFQGLLGFSVSTMEAWQATPAVNGVNLNQQQYNQSIRIYDTTKTVPLIKLSASHDLTKHIGLRFSLNYRFISGFSAHAPQGNGTSEVKLRNIYGVGLGIMYTF